MSLGNTVKTSASTVAHLQNLTHTSSPENALSHLSPAGQHLPMGAKTAVTAGHHLCPENPTAPSLLTSYPFLFVKSSLNSVPMFPSFAAWLLPYFNTPLLPSCNTQSPPQISTTMPVHYIPQPCGPIPSTSLHTLSGCFQLPFIFSSSGLRRAHPCPGK